MDYHAGHCQRPEQEYVIMHTCVYARKLMHAFISTCKTSIWSVKWKSNINNAQRKSFQLKPSLTERCLDWQPVQDVPTPSLWPCDGRLDRWLMHHCKLTLPKVSSTAVLVISFSSQDFTTLATNVLVMVCETSKKKKKKEDISVDGSQNHHLQMSADRGLLAEWSDQTEGDEWFMPLLYA